MLLANRKRRIIPPIEQPIERVIKEVRPKNAEQAELLKIIHNNNYIFLSGVAGGGKSYVSAGCAAWYLEKNIIEKIILSRPIVGAEKSFGALPGDLSCKIDPFMAPILQELSYFINVKKYLAEGKIEIIPVNFMRGYTFKNSFVIIDESENLTYSQLKLILTRIGEGTKVILNGDTDQSDLDYRHYKDFSVVIERIKKIASPTNGIATFHMKESVRNPLIKKILIALERDE